MDWRKTYRDKLCTAHEAVQHIESGDRIYVHSTVGIPYELLEALAQRRDELEDVTVFGAASPYPLRIFQSPQYRGHISYISNYLSSSEEIFYQHGNIQLASVQHSRMAESLTEVYKVNVLMLDVGMPDDEGYLYFGVGGTAAGWDVALRAEKIIFQLNRMQPAPLHGVNQKIHINDVTCLVEVEHPLPEYPLPRPTQQEVSIAQHILSYIEDNSTIQLDHSGVAAALGKGLRSKKGLALHTELYTDTMADLAKDGIVDGKQWATTALGRRALYDYVKQAPVQFAPMSILNNPREISKNERFVSVNCCRMADLTGQICTEYLDGRQQGGIGGQADYARGSLMSSGGKSFLCLPSTHKGQNGIRSSIVPALPPGSSVSVQRTDVMYVVTEYGVANLYLRTIQDRVRAMVAIAHPNYRQELLAAATASGLLAEEQQ